MRKIERDRRNQKFQLDSSIDLTRKFEAVGVEEGGCGDAGVSRAPKQESRRNFDEKDNRLMRKRTENGAQTMASISQFRLTGCAAWRSLLLFLLMMHMAALATGSSNASREILFPTDARAVIDVKRDCGAQGDGVADDTQAIQAAIEQVGGEDYTRFIYLPTGVYRITKTLVFKRSGEGNEGSMIGPWLWGQNLDNTVIRLADGANGFDDPQKPLEAIRGQSRPDGARMNADFFDRTLCNLTIDTGANAGAIGVKFYSNNTGLMENVRIRGQGVCGLDLGFNDQNGPLLIQDVEIEGFAIGIRTGHLLNSQTLSRVTVRARDVGLFHRGQVLAVESLKVLGAPLAIDSGGNGVLTLLDSELEGPAGGAYGPAIQLANGHLYVARLKTSRYSAAIASSDVPSGGHRGNNVTEYSSHPIETLGNLSSAQEWLTPEKEPYVPFPGRREDWVCANDFGAQAGDEEDDAKAFQRAIDEAAQRGATAVYILGKRGEPNWYWMRSHVRVHGSVQRVMGFGFVRILGGESDDPRYPENLSRFIVDSDAQGSKTVIFQNLHVFSPLPSFGIEARSADRTVVCRTIGGTVIARTGARVFMTNCVGHCYQEPESIIWSRQWNTEGGPQQVGINTRNNGGQLWILGMKTEAKSTKVATFNKGRTEVYGVHNYNTSGVTDETPFFRVENSVLSVAGYREVCFGGAWWKAPVVAILSGKTYLHPPHEWQTWTMLRVGE